MSSPCRVRLWFFVQVLLISRLASAAGIIFAASLSWDLSPRDPTGPFPPPPPYPPPSAPSTPATPAFPSYPFPPPGPTAPPPPIAFTPFLGYSGFTSGSADSANAWEGPNWVHPQWAPAAASEGAHWGAGIRGLASDAAGDAAASAVASGEATWVGDAAEATRLRSSALAGPPPLHPLHPHRARALLSGPAPQAASPSSFGDTLPSSSDGSGNPNPADELSPRAAAWVAAGIAAWLSLEHCTTPLVGRLLMDFVPPQSRALWGSAESILWLGWCATNRLPSATFAASVLPFSFPKPQPPAPSALLSISSH